MTVDLATLREHVGPGPSDAVLEDYLAAALEAIDDRYGPESDEKVEYLRPFGQWLKIGRRANEIVEVVEGGTTLDAADYVLWPDAGGRRVRRLSNDEPTHWRGFVEITYEPLSSTAGRDRITIALVNLDLTRPTSGLAGITVGPWSEQYRDTGGQSYQAAYEAILGSLYHSPPGTW